MKIFKCFQKKSTSILTQDASYWQSQFKDAKIENERLLRQISVLRRTDDNGYIERDPVKHFRGKLSV